MKSKSDLETCLLIGDQDEKKLKPASPPPQAMVPFLFFDLSHLPRTSQFTILSTAVFVFYVMYGVVMEKLFLIPGLKKEGFFLTLVQFIFYTIMAKFEMLHKRQKRRIPLKTYALLAGATLTTMSLSNASLGYLNYPTQVVFKCCKLIPVLIGGIILQRKKFSIMDFVAAMSMCIGLAIFTLADSKLSPTFDSVGIGMLSVALIADAVVSNLQEKSMKMHQALNAEVILYSYGIGTCYLLFFLILSGHLGSGIVSFATNPWQNYGLAFIFSLTGYLGMQVVLSLVRTFGAFVAVTVTSLRKALSVVISFVIFSKPFNLQYLAGGLIVVLGIYLNVASKNRIDLKLLYYGRLYATAWFPKGIFAKNGKLATATRLTATHV